ncbi:GAF domain-containing sensor histidine kinase [Marixanthomonas ophiurae]|uniref:histidine kinase n=1 Tax=Marixanthomonas ophiurae TaxID=387659 RepID=A0A3E1QD54_9FLAO|nr:GAF domain-containing protein [Marixanthomonas ophiurae]RFN60073.1 GAF domain-containing protein [Marixanthomonas ophiurae]
MNRPNKNIAEETNLNSLTHQLKQREAELSLLNSIQEAINKEIGMQGIYNMVGDKIRDLFDAQVVGIYTIDHDKQMEIFNFLYEDGELISPKPRKLDAVRKLLIDKKELILIDKDLPKKVAKISGMPATAVPGTKLPKSILLVPMVVRNNVSGYVSIQNLDRELAFSTNDVKLLETIANSMSVGLENARLFNEAEQRNAELSVINSVQQGLVAEMNMQGIYDLVGERIRNLFDAQVTGIYSFDHDTNMEHFHYLFEDGERIYPEPRPLNHLRNWIITNRSLLLVNENVDQQIFKITGKKNVAVPGTRLPQSMLFVPLMVGEVVKGCVSLQNLDKEQAFNSSDVRLLSTLANSMSVALENARLFNEAEQRNAELAVINGVQQGLVAEMDMQGIYELVGERIRSLFNAQVVAVSTFNHKEGLEEFNYIFEDGQRFTLEPRPIDTLRKKIIISKKLLYLNENVDEMWTAITGEVPTVLPGTQFTKSALYVPMITGKEVRGYVSLQNVESENAFSESDIRLLSTLANSMTVALENARLFNETARLLEETKQRATELHTVNKISHALVSQLDLKSLIKLIGDQMLQTFNADIVYLAIHDRKANMLHFPYMYGEDDANSREFGNGITEKIIISKEPLLINEDMERAYEEIKAEKKGKWVQSYLGVPIVIGDTATGVISVQSTERQNRFNEYDLRLLKTIAANVGVAMQNAEAYKKLQIALKELESAQEQLIQQEKLASLGQLSAGIAHEIKNPLNFVNNFSELNLELIDEVLDELKKTAKSDEKEEIKSILEDVVANQKKIHQHGSRADSIVKSMLLHSRGGNGIKEASQINDMLKEYVNLAFHGMRAGKKPMNVSLDFQLDASIRKVPVIIEDISRVILNLCNNAFDAMYERLKKESTEGTYQPKLTIKSFEKNHAVMIAIRDNGFGIPIELQDKILMPFFTTKRGTEGTGLGLSITNDIIKAHGGSLQVESKKGDDSFTKFIIKLPI